MDRWPMIGRVEEQAYLKMAINDPEQIGVLVAGVAGVGKTRLLREVATAALQCHVELLTATESARQLPFGALAKLLPGDLGTIDRVDLLAVIGRHLVRRAEGRPIVLAIDDIHLLDDFSAAFVHHVAVSGAATVVLTLRSGELAPDALTALYRDGIIHRIELQPISKTEFDRLIEAALGGSTERLTLDRMWMVTGGNVLFARELIGDALDAGTLVCRRGVWRWAGGVGIAPRLRETMASRLVGLSSRQRDLLEILAVGEPLSLDAMERLGPDVSIAHLERRGLLAIEGSDRQMQVRLAHPIFAEILRATMPASVYRQINHDLAEDLARASEEQSGDALKLALLREAAGESADPVMLVEAARNANLLSDHVLAERLARTSVREGAGFAGQLELGKALTGQNRLGESETVLIPLVGHEPSDMDRERLADAILLALAYGSGQVDKAHEIVELIEHDITDPNVKGLLQCHRATLLAFGARFQEAADLGMVALESVDDEATRVRSLSSVGISLVMSGRIDDALTLSEGTFEPALRLRDRMPRAPGWAVNSRCSALIFSGRAQEALALVDLALGSIPNTSSRVMAGFNVYRGRMFLALGRAASACRDLEDASASISDTPDPSWCLALAAEAHALLGHREEARAAAAESLALDRSEIRAYRPDQLRALAWVDAQNGRVSSAVDQLWAAADLATAQGQRSFELIILDDLLRLGERQAAQRARELTAHVDGAWSAAIAAHAETMLSGEATDLEAAARCFEAIGSSLVAAELWSAASAARQRDGLSARAAEAGRISAALVQQCEGAHTEALNAGRGPDPLSRRERETATLAARGATNAQIAAELSVSVRTVESHLYAAFAKLGIKERTHLLEVLQKESRRSDEETSQSRRSGR